MVYTEILDQWTSDDMITKNIEETLCINADNEVPSGATQEWDKPRYHITYQSMNHKNLISNNVTPYGGTKILSATIIRIAVPVDVMC